MALRRCSPCSRSRRARSRSCCSSLVLAGVAIAGGATDRAAVSAPALAVAVAALVELVLWRLFPGGGRYPFSIAELAAALVFCGSGSPSPGGSSARGCSACVFLGLRGRLRRRVPRPLGDRREHRAAPLRGDPDRRARLSLRRWRPLPARRRRARARALVERDAARRELRAGAGRSGRRRGVLDAGDRVPRTRTSTPSYRVEAVDTRGHWPAVYLPSAGIPLARGWFRQDDFPAERACSTASSAPSAYLRWLRALGVRYVVLTDAPPDYSARGEARSSRAARSPLRLGPRRRRTSRCTRSPRRGRS